MQGAKSQLSSILIENQRLRERLEEAEELLEAIRRGKVDAVVVDNEDRQVVYTLKGADHTYRLLVETMDEGALILSREGAILYSNNRFAEMLQLTQESLPGSDVHGWIDAADQERFRSFHRRAIEKESIKSEIALRSGSTVIPVLVSLSVLQIDVRNAVCMVVTDLSELKRAQETQRAYAERLYRKNLELRQRAEQLARLSVELTRTEQRERKRLSRILHDGLQQHLAAAKLQLGILANQIADGVARNGALEIEEMLNESIGLSRSLSTDLSPPILHAAGIEAALEWLVRWMRDMHDFKVDFEVPAKAPKLNEDSKALAFEAVRELLFNAVKHSKEKGAVLRLEALPNAQARIVVSDRGQGFDPFKIQTAQGECEGLGLFSIRERIGMIGGRFEIESAPGQGARFTLIVPESVGAPQAVKENLPPPAPASAAIASAAQGPFVRVLLADDHTLFRDGIARLLGKEPNIEVVGQACNGREAIDLSMRLNPHVILMDISMPEIDGIEATRIIHGQAPHIRIIGLSMYEDEERAGVMREAGAVDYRTKTCPAAELIAAVLDEHNLS